MNTENKKSIKRLTLDLEESLHTQLKTAAAQQGKSMKELVEGWVREKLKVKT